MFHIYSFNTLISTVTEKDFLGKVQHKIFNCRYGKALHEMFI